MSRSVFTPCIIDYVMASLVTNIIYSRIWPCAYKHFWSKNIFRNNKSTQNTMSIQTGRTRLWLWGLYRAPGSQLSPARLLSLTSRSVCAQCIVVYVKDSLITNVLDGKSLHFMKEGERRICKCEITEATDLSKSNEASSPVEKRFKLDFYRGHNLSKVGRPRVSKVKFSGGKKN